MEQCKAQKENDSDIQEKQKVEEKKQILESLRSRLLIDYSQNESEIGHILSTCKRPIRRDADSNEIKSMHVLKKRRSKILNDLKQLCQDEQTINMELIRCNKRIELSTKNLEHCREQLKASNGIANEIEKDKFGLPMVVGRNIGNVMNPLEARPLEVFNIIVQKSSYELIRDQVEKGLLLQKETLKESDEIWNSKLTWINEKSEYERFLGRLSIAADRLNKANDQNKRIDLNNALQSFWKSGAKLYPVEKASMRKLFQPSKQLDDSRYHILSDFVRKLRVEEQKGDRRIINLISELNASLKCKDKWWDSGIFFFVAQKLH